LQIPAAIRRHREDRGIAHKHGLPLIVDNTLATPYLVRPDRARRRHRRPFADQVHRRPRQLDRRHHRRRRHLRLVEVGQLPDAVGAAPEYGGVVLHETFGNFAFAIACRVLGLRDFGPAISPFNAFLILTGLETLPLRMQRHCDNAQAVAEWLSKHPKVAWVSAIPASPTTRTTRCRRSIRRKGRAPCSPSASRAATTRRQVRRRARAVLAPRQYRRHRSLVIHPASTTHRQLSDEQKVAAGAGPDVVRLSVGIEDVADIIADLEQALAKA
jgi:O-acetylhomoserine (thiol)-lyase